MSSGYTPYAGNGTKVDPKQQLMPPGTPGWTPGATFNDPAASGSGWTGVSSNADPYGVHNIGYDLSKIPGQLDNKGDKTDNLGRDSLLSAGGYSEGQHLTNGANQSNTSFIGPTLPDSFKFSGFSKYENQNAPDGSALGTDDTRIAQAQNTAQMNSAYPAFGNQYGLGGALPSGGQPSAAMSDYSGQGVTVNVPDTSSRGFNPWSIQGESNARDTQKGVSV